MVWLWLIYAIFLEFKNYKSNHFLKIVTLFLETITLPFIIELNFGIKINSNFFFIDLKIFTNNDNIFSIRYNRLTNQVNTIT